MSVVPAWQLPFLGLSEFPADLTTFEIGYFFHFTAEERTAIASRRGDSYRLAMAVHLGFIKMTGRTLAALERIPVPVLRQIGEQLGLPTPELATLRAMYGREQTLLDHQRWAAEVLGFRPFTERRQRVLVGELRKEAQKAITTAGLVQFAKRWLYEHRMLIPAERRLRELAARVYREAEQALYQQVESVVPLEIRQAWLAHLKQPWAGSGRPLALEWLQQVPKRRSYSSLEEWFGRLNFLRILGVPHYPLTGISLERQRRYAQQLRRRRPARFWVLDEPRQTLELVCFMHVTLLQVVDVIVSLADLRITDLRREALKRVQEREWQTGLSMRKTLADVRRFAEDASVSDAAVRQHVLDTIPADVLLFETRAAAWRHEFSQDNRRLRTLLRQLLMLRLEGPADSPVLAALATLKELYAARRQQLPPESPVTVPPRWSALVHHSDRKLALRAFEAATVVTLQKALRNGSVWVPESFSYRSRDQTLISAEDWQAHHRHHYQRLGLPLQPSQYLEPLLTNLEAGLTTLATAVRAGELQIDRTGLHLTRLAADGESSAVDYTRQRLFRQIGSIQWPALIVEIDSETRFSWTLLGRPPTNERELLTVYGALLAHGTELNAAGVALMMDSISETSITEAMQFLERDAALRQANDQVVEYQRRHEVVKAWGEGHTASSDAFSLDAPRHLWNARADPRRRTLAVGMYTHLLDQWGIIYDQPVVLGQRQAGVAIEGMVRQNAAELIERLTVDTHGFTDFGMAVAKLLGFDLCPRLKDLRDRKLHLPRDMAVPEELTSIVKHDVSLASLEACWDDLVRVAASIDTGQTSAVLALQRFGSAARGDPLHKAGTALGQLQRSLFLCDYFTNPTFRRELLRQLSHGESLHTLQRAIHFGGLTAAHGRRREELVAISGSMTLLTNLVLAWTTHQMQCVLDQWQQNNQAPVKLEIMRQIAPVHFRNINFRGEFHFPLKRHLQRLLPSYTPMAL